MIPKITIKDAIAHIHYNHQGTGFPKGSEFLSGEHATINGKTVWMKHAWVPRKVVIDRFKDLIGDKWDPKECYGVVGRDLPFTEIIFDSPYIWAKHGICPSGVRLFEVEDHDELQSLIDTYKPKERV